MKSKIGMLPDKCYMGVIKVSNSKSDLPTKFEVFISTHYEDTKDDAKYRKWGGLR